MVGYKTPSVRLFTFLNTIVISVLCLVCLLPILHVLMSSISGPHEVNVERSFMLFPKGGINAEAYKIILTYSGLWNGYKNTIFYVAAQCMVSALCAIIGGYILSRNGFRYKGAFMVFLIIPILFNGGMIPTYMVIQRLGLLDTFWVMILPGAMSTFNFILMRIAMQGIPESLEEAAKIDGAGEFTILFRIIMPLCRSTLAIVILFTAVAKWNDFFTALIYLPTRRDLYPLQMYIREILANATNVTSATQMVQNATIYDKLVQNATIIVSTVPILCIYPLVQKHFVKGIMLGGLKG